jgi:hypothetical protein
MLACSPAFLKGFKVFKGLLLKILKGERAFRKRRTPQHCQQKDGFGQMPLVSMTIVLTAA